MHSATLPAPTAHTTETPGHACNEACRKALYAICVCSCKGANHGANLGTGLGTKRSMSDRIAKAGGVFGTVGDNGLADDNAFAF